MGGFYGSVQVRSEDRDRIRQVAAEIAKARCTKCLLGPVLSGWVGVYSENGGQDQTFGEEIAKRLSCDVFHLLVHDDDIFAYWLWRGGDLVDSYWSMPGYFGEDQREEQEAMVGKPETYSHLLKDGIESMRELLPRDREDFIIEVERLDQFAQLLGISNAVTSYEYLKQGETEGIKGWKRFEELPGEEIAREKQVALDKRKELTVLKKQYKASGLLLTEVASKKGILRACSTSDGFAVARSDHGFTNSAPQLDFYSSPWKETTKLSVDMTPQVNRVISSSDGRFMAGALGKRIVVWDTENWQMLREVQENEWAIEVALSKDGRLLAHASHNEVVLTDSETGVCRKVLQVGDKLAFHPSGEYLLATLSVGKLGIADLRHPEIKTWRELRLTGKQIVSFEEITQKFQSISPEEMERQLRAKFENDWKTQFEKLPKKLSSMIDEKTLEQMREGIENALEKAVKAFEVLRSGPTTKRRTITPSLMKFTQDGQWLCCGTAEGFCIYSWPEILASSGEETPPPQFDQMAENEVSGLPGDYIYAIELEADNTGILFAGLSGQIFRFDMKSRTIRSLFTMPQEASILELLLSKDAQYLGIISRPSMRDHKNLNNQTAYWSVWSYPKMLAAAEA